MVFQESTRTKHSTEFWKTCLLSAISLPAGAREKLSSENSLGLQLWLSIITELEMCASASPGMFQNLDFRQGQVPDWDNQRDMELHPIEEVEDFEGIESLHLGEGDSVYFTPSGTPLRWSWNKFFFSFTNHFREGTGNGDVKGRRTHKRMVRSE